MSSDNRLGASVSAEAVIEALQTAALNAALLDAQEWKGAAEHSRHVVVSRDREIVRLRSGLSEIANLAGEESCRKAARYLLAGQYIDGTWPDARDLADLVREEAVLHG
jgi:hypothetical protein